MLVRYHGHNEFNAEIGDLLRFMDVTGKIRQGILLEVEEVGFPRNLTYFMVLEGDAVNRVNTNMIFRCRRL